MSTFQPGAPITSEAFTKRMQEILPPVKNRSQVESVGQSTKRLFELCTGSETPPRRLLAFNLLVQAMKSEEPKLRSAAEVHLTEPWLQ